MTTTANALPAPRNPSLTSLSDATLIIAVGLFLSSLFLPAFITQTHDINGYWVLAMGWLGFINFQFAWYATPFAILAIQVAKKSPQLGLFLSIIAIIIASEAFLFTDIPFGNNDKVSDYGIGFYLWYLCFYLVSFSVLLNLVAWGSVEEESLSEVNTDFNNKDNHIEQTKTYSSAALAKAKRIVVPKKIIKPVAASQRYNTQLPPPLPKKNIYLNKMNNEVTPSPPLPKSKWFAKPPPLPSFETIKKAITPPPLPVSRLTVTPFLDYKLKANYRDFL